MGMSVTAPTNDKDGAAAKVSVGALAALGVVYGDLGTSPLYTLQTVVEAMGGHFTVAGALGILSLIVWTLIITVSIKYCLFVMRADNHGEGGILALMSLLGANKFVGTGRILAIMGLLGAALIYGDGVITPAISVLSALEGVNVATTALKPYVLPVAVGVLLGFFALQRFGTAKIGVAFGPIMLIWFVVIGLLGLTGIIENPKVLLAIDPRYAISFLAHGGSTGFLVLGGVFLCITGAEALYADMGHFGAPAIRLSWYTVVLPGLLLSYAGQTALLIQKGEIHGNPFFQLAPPWAVYPLVAIATIATIIASQSIITGSFSMTRQAMQLGWLPGFNIRQTSDEVYGQIYVPVVNWLMMIATIGVTLAFRSSDRLAGAYGTAVSTTMLLTTILLFIAMLKVWKWPTWIACLIAGGFLIVDLGFFSANLLKIVDGGWLPLTFAALVFAIMLTWRWGVDRVHNALAPAPGEAERLVKQINAGKIPRVPGVAVFLTRSDGPIPPLLIDHIKHMGALHKQVICLAVGFEETPRVTPSERGTVEPVAEGVWRVTLRFGFVEIPDLPRALKALKAFDRAIHIDKAIYFASRDMVVGKGGVSPVFHWRLAVFAFCFRNAIKAIDRFSLPAQNVVEIARQIEI
jgi:KUP system potassium uptake protein